MNNQAQNMPSMNDEQRVLYFLKQVKQSNNIWILTDEHGCVMLNTEDEDCVPVWPDEQSAQSWATGEWQACIPESISLNKWFSRWTHGLLDDELCVVVYPNENEQGVVFFPDELEDELRKK